MQIKMGKKKAGEVILMSHKINLKTKGITGVKEKHAIMIKKQSNRRM